MVPVVTIYNPDEYVRLRSIFLKWKMLGVECQSRAETGCLIDVQKRSVQCKYVVSQYYIIVQQYSSNNSSSPETLRRGLLLVQHSGPKLDEYVLYRGAYPYLRRFFFWCS